MGGGGGRGYSHPDMEWGIPDIQVRSQVRMGGTPKWNSIACTWYAAGGMPLQALALRQEDFLVLKTIKLRQIYIYQKIKHYLIDFLPYFLK